MPDYSEIYRKNLTKTQSLYRSRLQRLINKTATDIAALANDPSAKFSGSFDLSKNARLNAKIDSIMLSYHDNMLETIQAGIGDSWDLSNVKNDAIANEYLRGLTSIKATEQYFKPNTEALQAFITRKRDALTLSDRIWKIAENYRTELEIHLGLGIVNGDSADTISRRIRYYQENPEMLFRRVRNSKGNLVLSKAAQEYHPGRGVYRSSYKNALRLSRNETNLAYRSADHERWSQMDFVVGVQVSLSASHPIRDICDDCQGAYPKEFKFSGWHTSCFCISTPILMSKEDFMARLAGAEYQMPGNVEDVPEGFKLWVEANKERVSGWKSTPYWVQDNFKNGNILRGLKALK